MSPPDVFTGNLPPQLVVHRLRLRVVEAVGHQPELLQQPVAGLLLIDHGLEVLVELIGVVNQLRLGTMQEPI